MVSHLLIGYLLSDRDSLVDYTRLFAPAYSDVKRRLLLLHRQQNRAIPDHYYRLAQEKCFEGIDSSLSELIRLGLYRLAKEHLELRDNRIYVKQTKQNAWQELITHVPPLVLQMAFLHIEKPLADRDIAAYFREYILPNTKYTALPYPYIIQIETYIKEKNGLHDLHMHLNGSTEVDVSWQDFLSDPSKVYKELKGGKKNPLVLEQVEQESHLRDPKEFRDMLLCARRIRYYLFDMLYPDFRKKDKSKRSIPAKGGEEGEESCSISKVLSALVFSSSSCQKENVFPDSGKNPFADLVCCGSEQNKYPMAVEGLMYLLLFRYLAESPRECVASVFHFYLLILGLANRLLVQQIHQFGFEQFQKFTVNELRSLSEKAYRNRFLQLHGNEQRNIRFLEGRFSPKKTELENESLLDSVFSGWNDLLKNIQSESIGKTSPYLPELKLIAHFIKQKDKGNSEDVRHKELRTEIWHKAKVLALQKSKYPSRMKDIVGVDAAASEFDAPPEVFAPAFRHLRRKGGFKHFTYHAGEDFYHIIGGLRAVYEAVTFNNLMNGDRVGHATATGVDPKVWLRNVGKQIYLRQGEYLDDLLFTYHMIISTGDDFLKDRLPALTNKIQELSYQVYQKTYPLRLLEAAWLLRRYCPILMFAGSRDRALIESVFDDDEWCDIQNEVTDLNNDERVELLRKYHCKSFRKNYNKIIEVDVTEFYSPDDIIHLQLMMLKFLHEREIVIETLPTSNIRIGHHFNFESYHLWNWLKWEKEGYPIPPIVVGTDDAGIFATNIYNEYANIYCCLVTNNGVSHNEAMKIVEKLDKNGRIYRFV